MTVNELNKTAWAEINLNKLITNIEEIRRKIGSETQMMAVVKGNAYGHGLAAISRFLVNNGVDGLAVSSVNEALEIRKQQIEEPILVLGVTQTEDVRKVIDYNIISTAGSLEYVNMLAYYAEQSGKKAKIHIRVDFGLGNLGILPKDVVFFVKQIMNKKWIEIEGIYTHLSSLYENNQEEIMKDLTLFESIVEAVRSLGVSVPFIHAVSSPGIMTTPKGYYNMVRAGIILYGMPALIETKDENIKPIMELKAKVMRLEEYPANITLGGYGQTEDTQKPIKIATVPIGYADGLFLYSLEEGEVLIHGHRVPILKHVYMDTFIVDVTNMPQVQVGDEVVIFGKQGNSEITIEELALKAKIDLMHCDMITLLSSRIPRLYVLNGRVCCSDDVVIRGKTNAPF